MPMRVPFHLLRREKPETSSGLLLLSTELKELLNLCGRVGGDPLPPIFPVADGFLILIDTPPTATLPTKTLRLRRWSENCYLPVDADLVPALLPDEAMGLTRQRGLIFLPGACLAFAVDQPLAAAALLRFPSIQRRDWKPFPGGTELADRLTTITRVVPDITPDDVLAAGGSGIGKEAPPRPPAVGSMKAIAGRIALGFGKGLTALGSALGVGAIARVGAALVGAAVAAVPRLSEQLLGKQEAALRELLRKFREGRIDEALTNALPMGGPGGSDALHTSDQLPTHDTRWSLLTVFGLGGPSTVWVGGGADIQRELMEEYRRAAQAAVARGDYRRAAFIYGKLLNDIRTAADVLAKGGLHRDAAILYRDLLKEPRWAAREFEAAGEWDEALRLYRLIGEHEPAGDLLRRIGQEDEAIDEYHRAAKKRIDDRRDFLLAGDLMLRKTGRADLAGAYFMMGWRGRDEPSVHVNNALGCAQRLAEIYAFAVPPDPLWALIDEVEAWLAPAGNVSGTADFFNLVMKLADQPHLQSQRAELRDRCRLALAGQMRNHVQYERRGGNVVSDLFGQSGRWPAAVVADAGFAMRSALRAKPPLSRSDRPVNTIRFGTGTVTAVAFAPDSEDVFVGFESGELVCYQPRDGRLTKITDRDGDPIHSIATNSSGSWVVSASSGERVATQIVLRSFRRSDTNFHSERERAWNLIEPGWFRLNPLIFEDKRGRTFLTTSSTNVEFSNWFLFPKELPNRFDPSYLILPLLTSVEVSAGNQPVFESGASLPIDDRGKPDQIVVQDTCVRWGEKSFQTGWTIDDTGLASPWIAWLPREIGRIEIAGISAYHTIAWSEVRGPDGIDDGAVRTLMFQHPEGLCAVAIWKPGELIGVTGSNRICWLRAAHQGFREWANSTEIAAPTKAVACFPNHATGEAIIILADGEAVRVPVPL